MQFTEIFFVTEEPTSKVLSEPAVISTATAGISPEQNIPHLPPQSAQSVRNVKEVDIDGKTYRIDMEVIDPYKSVIVHGGKVQLIW